MEPVPAQSGVSPRRVRDCETHQRRSKLGLAERECLADLFRPAMFGMMWAAGEDLDEQSGVSHLAHIRACCGILMDAIDAGAFLDGRRVSPETIRILKAYDASRMPVVKPVEPAAA